MSKALEELATAVKKPPTSKTETASSKAPITSEDRLKALKVVELSLNKQFSCTNSLMRLGDRVGQLVPSFSTDIHTLDWEVIGSGGIPKGRIVEIYGPESAGKTTLALHIAGQEQKRGNLVAFVDAEHALDITYASKLGVEATNLIVAQPDSGEQALTAVVELVESKAVSLIIVDSVAALVPMAELEGDMGASHMGLQARLMSQAMRKLRGICATNGVTVIFLNQIRMKIGVVFGNPEETTGGRALKFFASLRLDVRRKEAIKSGDVVIGHQIKIKAVKNKVGPPFRETLVDLLYDNGIDTVGDLASYAVNLGVITKSGAWFDVPVLRAKDGEKPEIVTERRQGINQVKEFLHDDAAALETVNAEITRVKKLQAEAEKQ